MDTDRLSRELIRSLRGRRSQPALSRRLGFTSNAVYAWESGRRAPAASTFFTVAARSGIDVSAALARFLGADAHAALAPFDAAGVARLLHTLRGGRPVTELAAQIGSDRTTLGRWLAGKTEPRLPELLRYVQATTQRLLELIALFVDPAALPSARAAHADLLAQRHLAYALPWSHAVLRALELDAYRALPRHRPGFIARCIGISLEEEQRQLAALLAAKQIRKVRGRYRALRVLTVDTSPNERGNRQLKLHWAEVGLERLRNASAPKNALFSYNLFPIAGPELERIRQLHAEYYERVREIIAQSRSADRVVLMNLQLIPLHSDDEPGIV